MKKHVGSFSVAILLLGSGAAHSQLYVPIPPTTGENRFQLLLTNLGTKPTFFHSEIYSPRAAPRSQGRFDLQAGQSVFQEQAGSIGGFQVVDVDNRRVTASSRLTGPDEAHVRRLPVFTSRDIIPRQKRVTFQLSPRLEPHESVSFVVFSVTLNRARCSVTLYNDLGRVASSSLTVRERRKVAVAEISDASSASFAQVACDKPFLSFAYHGTPPTVVGRIGTWRLVKASSAPPFRWELWGIRAGKSAGSSPFG